MPTAEGWACGSATGLRPARSDCISWRCRGCCSGCAFEDVVELPACVLSVVGVIYRLGVDDVVGEFEDLSNAEPILEKREVCVDGPVGRVERGGCSRIARKDLPLEFDEISDGVPCFGDIEVEQSGDVSVTMSEDVVQVKVSMGESGLDHERHLLSQVDSLIEEVGQFGSGEQDAGAAAFGDLWCSVGHVLRPGRKARRAPTREANPSHRAVWSTATVSVCCCPTPQGVRGTTIEALMPYAAAWTIDHGTQDFDATRFAG